MNEVREQGSRRDDTNPMAVVGLSVGVVALVAAWIPWVGAGVSLLGLLLSWIGFRGAGRTGEGRSLAVTGLTLSLLALFLGGAATTCSGIAQDTPAHRELPAQD